MSEPENHAKNFEIICHNCLPSECDVKTCPIRVKALEEKRLEIECAQFRQDLAAWPA